MYVFCVYNRMFLTVQKSSVAGQLKTMSVVHPKGQIQQHDEHSCGLAILLEGMFLILVIPEHFIT